jgi:hypothetical protein
VASLELERIHGESNLNAVRDGRRVLRTILSEYRRRHSIKDAALAFGLVPAPDAHVAAAPVPVTPSDAVTWTAPPAQPAVGLQRIFRLRSAELSSEER